MPRKPETAHGPAVAGVPTASLSPLLWRPAVSLGESAGQAPGAPTRWGTTETTETTVVRPIAGGGTPAPPSLSGGWLSPPSALSSLSPDVMTSCHRVTPSPIGNSCVLCNLGFKQHVVLPCYFKKKSSAFPEWETRILPSLRQTPGGRKR